MADADMQADLLGSEMTSEIQAYAQTQQLLLAAAQHDLKTLKALLKTVPATVRDPSTGYTGLHAAIASSPSPVFKQPDAASNGSSAESDSALAKGQDEDETKTTDTIETLRLLLQDGAIWNDLDTNNETPGCVAWRMGLVGPYEVIVDAGVRAELLMNRLDDFEMLSDADDQEQEDDIDEGGPASREEASRLADAAVALEDERMDGVSATIAVQSEEVPIEIDDLEVIEEDDSTLQPQYLSSSLSFTSDRILDASANGVMMAWEKGLMERSAAAILPTEGLKILNVGFGMGIFDTFVQQQCAPIEHHIVEAHPDVLSRMKDTGWESTAPTYDRKNVTIHAGTWQEVLPKLIEQNITFDAIFFDTFAEDYKAFREFFGEYVIGLLEQEGRWSFFHGLGADRQVCYDVYTRVVEMDLFEAGFEVEWEDVELPELKSGPDETGPWDGVKRSYFSVEKYRLPRCKFVS